MRQVINFFFVTVVLMNLLIAMLSSTYEEIRQNADTLPSTRKSKSTQNQQINYTQTHLAQHLKEIRRSDNTQARARRTHARH